MQDTPEIQKLLLQRKPFYSTDRTAYNTLSAQIHRLRHPEKYAEIKRTQSEIRSMQRRSVRVAKRKTYSNYKEAHEINEGLVGMYLFFRNIEFPGDILQTWRRADILGCSMPDFYDHIARLCARHGWTWANWNIKWTLDHVVPVRYFWLPVEKRACWHYTNLRPLAIAFNHRGN